MASAVNEFVARCRCHIEDGKRDVDAIMSDSFEDEVHDWFIWELIDKYISMSDLREQFEDECREALFDEVRDEIESMVEEAEEEDDSF